MRKYGHNKENRPNPIVQMGLLWITAVFPLAFVITDGSQNEQTTMVPLEKQIMKDFELSNFSLSARTQACHLRQTGCSTTAAKDHLSQPSHSKS